MTKWNNPVLAIFAATVVLPAPTYLSFGLIAGLATFFSWQWSLVPIFAGLLVHRFVSLTTISIHYHRGLSHGHVEFWPPFEFALRVFNFFWLSSARVFAIMHRKHHALTDQAGDPHSPNIDDNGILGAYQNSVRSFVHIARTEPIDSPYAVGLPNDLFERFAVWTAKGGLVGMALSRAPLIFCLTWALVGGDLPLVESALLSAACMPSILASNWFFGMLVVNGFAHRVGYRSFDLDDGSHNLIPIDIFGVGEMLHHNHHAFPGRAKFSVRRGELDLTWWVIRLCAALRLLRVRQNTGATP